MIDLSESLVEEDVLVTQKTKHSVVAGQVAFSSPGLVAGACSFTCLRLTFARCLRPISLRYYCGRARCETVEPVLVVTCEQGHCAIFTRTKV